MTTKSEEKKGVPDTSRRKFMTSVAAAAIVAGAVAGVGGYLAAPKGIGTTKTVTQTAAEKTITTTATSTVTQTPTPGQVITRFPGKTVKERAENGVKKLIADGKIAKGTKLVGLVYAGAPGAYTQWIPYWKDTFGIDLSVDTVPITESYDKIMAEAVSKTGAWDFFASGYDYRGDFLDSKVIQELTAWQALYDDNLYGEPNGVTYPLCFQCSGYMDYECVSLPYDSDTQMMFIRKDLLESPKEQEAFEKQYGYPLKIPETWDEFTDQVHFFHRPPDLYGNNDMKSFWWQINPFLWNFYPRKFPYLPLFDEDFNPTIDSPEGIATVEFHVDIYKHAHPDQVVWGYAEQYAFWQAGKAYIEITYPSAAKFMEMPSVSTVVGKNKTAMLPGHWVTTPEGAKVLNRKTSHVGTQVLYVSNYSKNPELAYLFCQWMNSPENIVANSINPESFTDITRYNQFRSIEQAMKWGGGENTGLDAAIEKLEANYKTSPYVCPSFNFSGGWEFSNVLDKNLSAALAGTMTPEQCVKETANTWRTIAQRVGVEKLKKAYAWVISTFPLNPL